MIKKLNLKKRKEFNKKAQGFTINKLLVVILVLMVIAAVIMFLVRNDINKWLRNLPGFYYPEEDVEVDYTGESDEVVLQCFSEAFWSNSRRFGYDAKIKSNEEVEPGPAYIALKIENIEKCDNYLLYLDKKGFTYMLSTISEESLNTPRSGWIKTNDFYYYLINLEDSGSGESGIYSFRVTDNSGKLLYNGYEIKVEEPGIWK